MMMLHFEALKKQACLILFRNYKNFQEPLFMTDFVSLSPLSLSLSWIESSSSIWATKINLSLRSSALQYSADKRKGILFLFPFNLHYIMLLVLSITNLCHHHNLHSPYQIHYLLYSFSITFQAYGTCQVIVNSFLFFCDPC